LILFPAFIYGGLYFSGDAIREKLFSIDFKTIPKEDYNQMLLVGLEAIFVFIAFRLNKVVLLIVLSPILALLSAKTERILEGNQYPFRFDQFIKDIKTRHQHCDPQCSDTTYPHLLLAAAFCFCK